MEAKNIQSRRADRQGPEWRAASSASLRSLPLKTLEKEANSSNEKKSPWKLKQVFCCWSRWPRERRLFGGSEANVLSPALENEIMKYARVGYERLAVLATIVSCKFLKAHGEITSFCRLFLRYGRTIFFWQWMTNNNRNNQIRQQNKALQRERPVTLLCYFTQKANK